MKAKNVHATVASISILLCGFFTAVQNCTATDSGHSFKCSGPMQMRVYTDAGSPDQTPFLKAISEKDVSSRDQKIAPFLQKHLGSQKEDYMGDWILEELSKTSWFIDLSPFEMTFRNCRTDLEKKCEEVFIRNKLIHGERAWKTAFLEKVLSNPHSQDRRARNGIKYDGFRIKMEPSEAADWVVNLGLSELRPMVEKLYSRKRCIGDVGPNDQLDGMFEMVGTAQGNENPVVVLTRRLNAMLPEEVTERILSDDCGFKVAVSRYQRFLQIEEPIVDDDGRRMLWIRSPILDDLMKPLANAYLSYLTDPPFGRFLNIDDYRQATDKVRYYLRGTCSSDVNLDGYAFDSRLEQYDLERKSLRAVLEYLGLDPGLAG